MAKVINEQKKHTPAPRAQVFTDEEVIGLEQSFIDSYLSSDTRPIRILFRIYRRFCDSAYRFSDRGCASCVKNWYC